MESEEQDADEPSQRTITTPTHLKSSVWKYFGFYTLDGNINKEKAVCRLCKKQFSYAKTTTNLRAHLLSAHPDDATELEGTSGAAKSNVQSRLTTYYTSAAALPEVRKRAITNQIATFICKDMRPVSVIEGAGFQGLVRELEPRYKIPCRTTITDRIVKLYDITRENVRTVLKGQKTLSLTTDGWTSLATDAYVTVTAHWISDK